MAERPSGSGTEIIAHRGSSFLAPENTLAALLLGWRETATCEVDVRPTRDGRLIVVHDASMLRTAGVDWPVAERTLASLRQLDIGAWKGREWKGEKLRTLDEIIAAMPAGKRLLVEVKAGPEVVPELARAIRASGKARRVRVHSFDYATCVATRKALPRTLIYYLIASKRNTGRKHGTKKWTPSLPEAIKRAREAKLDGIGANDTSQITAASVRKLHEEGLRLNIWTVDDPIAARRLIARGVDGLITNRPRWLKDAVSI